MGVTDCDIMTISTFKIEDRFASHAQIGKINSSFLGMLGRLLVRRDEQSQYQPNAG